MADTLSIARPYAVAAFDYAREKQQLPAWKVFLEAAALVSHDATVTRLLSDPETSANKASDLFEQVLKVLLDVERKNFLHLMAQNKRLLMLPAVVELFNAYYAYYEKISTIRVTTAIDIDVDFRKKLSQALSQRVQREVTLHCDVNPAILGGAVIQIGDRVIDGSIRGQLTRLLQNLTG